MAQQKIRPERNRVEKMRRYEEVTATTCQRRQRREVMKVSLIAPF